MPLVRQTLYAQNVNLYLAPTADGRDAWLSAMRTIGVEGRCFVVTSNMAVQKPGTSANASSNATRPRRNSTITQDGHEIVLPGGSPRSKRRKSVIDENGNEIVLGCDEDAPSAAGQATGRTEWASRGGSAIVNPFGDVVAGPQWEDDQGIIFADIDMRDCVRGRLDIDNAGSYSRNDSFKFSVQGLDLDPLPY